MRICFGYKISNQRFRYLVIILLIILVINVYVYYHFQTFYDSWTDSLHISHLNEIQQRLEAKNHITKLKPRIKYSVLKIPQKDLLTYLIMLQNSISFFEVPLTNQMRFAHAVCKLRPPPDITSNMHSLEHQLPWILNHMNSLSEKYLKSNPSTALHHFYDLFQILHQPNRKFHHAQYNNYSAYETPLFYYVHAYFYTTVHCSHKRRFKENWKGAYQYLLQIAPSVVNSPQWKMNSGLDFVSSGSHPKSGPFELDPFPINEFIEQTFLRVDTDIRGHKSKDIIVPYYVAFSPAILKYIHKLDPNIKPSASIPKLYFIYFAGGNHPKGGLRYQLEKRIIEWKLSLQPNEMNSLRSEPLQQQQQQQFLDPKKVPSLPIVAPDRVVVQTVSASGYNSTSYIHHMLNTEFCLSLRGDTTSSVRLFEIIALNCIPVIIADWVILPFESIIDYDKFSIRLPESIVHNIPLLLSTLSKITTQEKEEYYKHLLEAREFLLFYQFPTLASINATSHKPHNIRSQTQNPQNNRRSLATTFTMSPNPSLSSFLPLLNPVTSVFVDLIHRRLQYCQQFYINEEEISLFDGLNKDMFLSSEHEKRRNTKVINENNRLPMIDMTNSIDTTSFCHKLFKRRNIARELIAIYKLEKVQSSTLPNVRI